jgi:putative ABC transport system permease protein
MNLLRIAWASLVSRKSTSLLTLISIAVSVALLISVERLKQGAEEGFTGAISQTDLIVGGRTGPLNLLMYTVFNLGSASNQVGMESYEKYKAHPAVEWTIPISLGDGHRGFRVVATNQNFYTHYRFKKDKQIELVDGVWSTGLWDVVLGADVARKLQYKLGDQVVLTHGVTSGEGILDHDDKPFRVVGRMQPTGTALDQSLYITLEGMEGIHIDWKDGAMPRPGTEVKADSIKPEDVKPQNITAFFLRTKTRIETLRLQREINTDTAEPLMAIIPGVALAELWRSLGHVESALRGISWIVLLTGLSTLIVALLTSLGARRREMAILRAVGASPLHVLGLLAFEAVGLVGLGVLMGYAFQSVGFWALGMYLKAEYGVVLSEAAFSLGQVKLFAGAMVLGLIAGLIPAISAFRMSVKDGLRPPV